MDPYLCHWKCNLLFVLPTLCFCWSSVKQLVTTITLPLGRLTGGLQVKWCQLSSLTSMHCPEQSLSLSDTLTCLMWNAEILPSLPWSCLPVHICISLCGLLHLTKSPSTLYQTLSLILLISSWGFCANLCDTWDCHLYEFFYLFLCRTIAEFCKEISKTAVGCMTQHYRVNYFKNFGKG